MEILVALKVEKEEKNFDIENHEFYLIKSRVVSNLSESDYNIKNTISYFFQA